ncbi:MAG: PAS domain S-box protein [Ignavibacteriae bacterium]|nr:PAS domain S-box protein [Ignavibacteriota bacterium]
MEVLLTTNQDPQGTDSIAEVMKKAEEQSWNTFGNLLESLPFALLVVDSEGIITQVNVHTERLFGYEREELLNKYVETLLPERFRHIHMQHRTDYATAPRARNMGTGLELYGRRKDGTEFPVDVALGPMKLDGTFFIICVIRDITEQKRALEELTIAEERYRNIFENAVEGIFQSTPDGHFIDVNPAFARILGYESREEVLSTIKDIRKQLYLDSTRRDEMQQLLAEYGVIHGFQSQLYRKDGGIIWVSESLRAVRDSNGEIIYYEGMLEDITELTLIKERDRELAELLNITPDAVIVQDMQDRVVFWNKGAEEIYGWSIEEISGQAIKRFIYDSGSPDYDQMKQAVLENGKWRGELNQLRKDRQKIIVEGRLVLVPDHKGLPKSILMVGTDVTREKALEKQFYHAQRLENMGTLAVGIAHDLNNILATILLSVDILKKNLPNEDAQRLLDMVIMSTVRGKDIINQVLGFSRSGGGEQGEIQLRHIAKEIGQIIEETFPKSIRLQLEITKTLWTIIGDATQVHQVLMNLCVNARDAMPKGGILQISVGNTTIDEQYARMQPEAKPGLYVVLDVSDTGTGIPPDILNKIFDPFFTTKPLGEGTGLGLATVKSIVKSHNGFINVYSVVGKGTTFKVYFPAAPRTETGEMEKEHLVLVAGHGELILLVDDEPSVLEVTKQTLEIYGYHTLTAMDGTEALAHYVQHKGSISLVITDVIMPNLDGVATIRALRKINPHVRVIATSGLTIGEHIDQSIYPEIQAFLQKPYSAEKLLRTLHQVLSKTDSDHNCDSQP